MFRVSRFGSQTLCCLWCRGLGLRVQGGRTSEKSPPPSGGGEAAETGGVLGAEEKSFSRFVSPLSWLALRVTAFVESVEGLVD
jgi:hypothetical protein